MKIKGLRFKGSLTKSVDLYFITMHVAGGHFVMYRILISEPLFLPFGLCIPINVPHILVHLCENVF